MEMPERPGGGAHPAGEVRVDRASAAGDSLSPGERTRAAPPAGPRHQPRCSTNDNHLDLPAIEQLEQAVESFDGTVLLVTHDRRMRDAFRATRTVSVDGGRVTDR